MFTIQSPAKINLTLEVLAKRADSYHEIRSVIQTINLCDSLHFELADKINFNCDDPDVIQEESLGYKAAILLRQYSNCSKGASIKVSKCIPLISGLGGDSSNAAVILLGLNRLWGLRLSKEKLSAKSTDSGGFTRKLFLRPIKPFCRRLISSKNPTNMRRFSKAAMIEIKL